MRPKWKKLLYGDKVDKEFTLILVIAVCSVFFGIMLFIFEEIKNLLIMAGNVNSKDIPLYAPLVRMEINIMALWDLALIVIFIVYFVALTSVFYYTKKRMSAKNDSE